MSGWIGAWGNAATVTNLTVTGSEIISVNSSTNALRITQTGTGNALLVEDSANPDSTPFTVDTNGNLIIGTTATFTGLYGGTNKLSIAGANSVCQAYFADTTVGIRYDFLKSRGTTIGSHAPLISGDDLGGIFWGGSDGTSFIPAASIKCTVDGTPGTNDMPGRLVFSTTPDNASSPTTKMQIDNGGNIYGIAGTTSMTNGFFYIPAASGAPSGTPTAVTGRVPMYYDTTNNNFYVYNGAWKKVLLG